MAAAAVRALSFLPRAQPGQAQRTSWLVDSTLADGERPVEAPIPPKKKIVLHVILSGF